MVKHKCNICNYETIYPTNYKNHLKSKKHIRNVEKYNEEQVNPIESKMNKQKPILNKPKHICSYCDNIYSTNSNLHKHLRICKVKKELDEEKRKKDEEKKEEKEVVNKLLEEITKMREKIEILETMVVSNNKDVKELYKKINLDNEVEKFMNNNIEEKEEINNKLIDLEIKEGYKIVSREQDNYVDVTNLCKANSKLFGDWKRLSKTINFLSCLSETMGIPIDHLIKYDNNNNTIINNHTWVHPQVAINIAQWISPELDVKVSQWISDIILNKKILIENKSKNIYIKKLQKKILKKQPRIQYKEENVIYLLTTYELEKKRIYILGKATNLTKRLTNYNKSEDHKVVYYRTCATLENMDIIEKIILKKLEKYKEKVNRERVILPKLYPISFFKDMIDESIDFIIKPINNADTIQQL